MSHQNGESWLEDLHSQFVKMIDKHQEHKIRGMEQMSQMALKPMDHKIFPESTCLDEIVDDLTIPEKHRSKTYIPVEIIKLIYNSMNQIYSKLSKIQEDVDLNQISKKIEGLRNEINDKGKKIDAINQTLLKQTQLDQTKTTALRCFKALAKN